MGKASRRKRERRTARSSAEPVRHELEFQVPSDAGSGIESGPSDVDRRWGGRRVGAGRPRVYATAAERQVAYRARRRPNVPSGPFRTSTASRQQKARQCLVSSRTHSDLGDSSLGDQQAVAPEPAIEDTVRLIARRPRGVVIPSICTVQSNRLVPLHRGAWPEGQDQGEEHRPRPHR